MTFTSEELQAILDLIEYHDDLEECSEQLGIDVEQLYNKVSALQEQVS